MMDTLTTTTYLQATPFKKQVTLQQQRQQHLLNTRQAKLALQKSSDTVHFGVVQHDQQKLTEQQKKDKKALEKKQVGNIILTALGGLSTAGAAAFTFFVPILGLPVAAAVGGAGVLMLAAGIALIVKNRQKQKALKPPAETSKPRTVLQELEEQAKKQPKTEIKEDVTTQEQKAVVVTPITPKVEPSKAENESEKQEVKINLQEAKEVKEVLDEKFTFDSLTAELQKKIAPEDMEKLKLFLAEFIADIQNAFAEENIEKKHPKLMGKIGKISVLKTRTSDLLSQGHERNSHLKYQLYKLLNGKKLINLEATYNAHLRTVVNYFIDKINNPTIDPNVVEDNNFYIKGKKVPNRKGFFYGLITLLFIGGCYKAKNSNLWSELSLISTSLYERAENTLGFVESIKSNTVEETSTNEFDDYFEFLISGKAEGTGKDNRDPGNPSKFGITVYLSNLLASRDNGKWPEQDSLRAKLFKGIAKKVKNNTLTKEEAKPLAKEYAWIMSGANEQDNKDMAWLTADTYYNNGSSAEEFIRQKAIEDSEKNGTDLFDEYEKWRIKAWRGDKEVPKGYRKKKWHAYGAGFINRQNRLRELVGRGKRDQGYYELLHFVKPGQNVFRIALDYGITQGVLAGNNTNLIDPNNFSKLEKHVVLKVPQWKHKVLPGETFGSVSKKYGIPPESILLLNTKISASDEDDIENSVIELPDDQVSIDIPFWIYVVKSDDTPENIKKETGIDSKKLASLNGIDSENITKNGLSLIVPGIAADKSMPAKIVEEKNLNKLFISPVDGKRNKNRGFARYKHPIYGDMRMHWGYDYKLKHAKNNKIMSVYPGKVVEVTWSKSKKGLGNHVVVDHGVINGKSVKTEYAHCSNIHVKVGQEVKAGKHIADIGNTGGSTGPHLHFVVFENGKRVNPKNYGLN